MDPTALPPLPHHPCDSTPESSCHGCGSLQLSISLVLAAQGPRDSVAALTGDDKMPLWRGKAEKRPRANAWLALRGFLEEPLTCVACQGRRG